MCNLSVLYIVYIDLNTVYDEDNLTISLRFLSTLQQYDSSLFFAAKVLTLIRRVVMVKKKKEQVNVGCWIVCLCCTVQFSLACVWYMTSSVLKIPGDVLTLHFDQPL